MSDRKPDREVGRGLNGGVSPSGSLSNLKSATSHLQSILEALPYPTAPLSPPRAGYGKDAEIRVKELGLVKEGFRDLNQRLQKMGYKLVRSRYSWYWWR